MHYFSFKADEDTNTTLLQMLQKPNSMTVEPARIDTAQGYPVGEEEAEGCCCS